MALQHVGVDSLSDDPRTAAMTGSRGALAQTKSMAGRLLQELGPSERVYKVLLSTNLVPQLVVLTDRRLLSLPVGSARPAQAVAPPYRVEVGKAKLMGQGVTATDRHGARIAMRLLQPDDLASIQGHATSQPTGPSGQPGPAFGQPEPSFGQPPGAAHDGSPGAVPGAPGGWRWGRPVVTPVDAEHLAAAHMAYLGFQGAMVTQASSDGGLEVVAVGAAAQVKYHAAPTGSPDVQQLRGAAEPFPNRLFYATGYTPHGTAAAHQLNVALFQFTPDSLVVAVNDTARAIAAQGYTPPPSRGVFGGLTFEARQNRAVGWAHQIEAAARTPISDRRRKGDRQLRQREVALRLLTQGLVELQDSDNPLYKKGRKERALTQAEKTLKSAAQLLAIRLR